MTINRTAWARTLPIVVALAATGAAAAQGVEVLDRAAGPAAGPGGIAIDELSGLAWDADEGLLYAVSDGGTLHHFRLRLDGGKIAEIEPVFSVELATAAGETSDNAEGIAVLNGDNGKPSDTELLIALEDGPSIVRFTPRGERIGGIALPGPLADPDRYDGKNSGLESVATDARHGVLTAPEEPMSGQPRDLHTIYAEDGATWSFGTFQPRRSNVKAIEILPDGGALVLERTRDEKDGPSMARLRYLDIADCASGTVCEVTDLGAPADAPLTGNFEGMTRITGDLFLLVSDRKRKDAEPTTFVLLRVTPPG